MSTWDERFENHPARAALEQLEQLLAGTRSLAESESSALENWERINRVASYARKRFAATDALLVSPTNLNNIATASQYIINELTAYQTDRNVGHLINANSNLDGTIYHFFGLPDIKTVDDIADLREATSSYRKSVSQLARNLQEDVAQVKLGNDALREKFSEFTNEISVQKTRLDAAIAQFQQQFSTDQASRQNEFAASQIKNHELFTSAEEDWKSNFDALVDKTNTMFQELKTSILTQNDDLIDSNHGKASDLIKSLELNLERAQRIVGIISETGMAHGYQTTANEERKASMPWKIIAVASLSIWIVAGLVFFFLTYKEDLSWPAVARQLLISTPFILLSGFAAMQVSQHQRVERSTRRTELEIASIDPFLETLDDEDKKDAKRSLVDKFFGQRESDSQKSESKRMLSLMVDLAKIIQQLQTSIRK